MVEALEKLDKLACFLRGMTMDPRIPADTKEALSNKVSEIEKFVEENEENAQ